jgi:hypothetical protein
MMGSSEKMCEVTSDLIFQTPGIKLLREFNIYNNYQEIWFSIIYNLMFNTAVKTKQKVVA